MPELEFPVFPKPDGSVTIDDETGIVSMPLEYYRRIAVYKASVDEQKRIYEELKSLHAVDGTRNRTLEK